LVQAKTKILLILCIRPPLQKKKRTWKKREKKVFGPTATRKRVLASPKNLQS